MHWQNRVIYGVARSLHQGKYIIEEGNRLLNLSSNDYLGLAADEALRNQFMETVREEDFLFFSSSSRLLTGNFEIYRKVEQLLGLRFIMRKVRWYSAVGIT